MVKLLYKPLGALFGVLGAVAASAAFSKVWQAVSGDNDAPDAMQEDRSWGEVLSAAAIQGAIFGSVKALVDRGGATAFQKATGQWPGTRSDDALEEQDNGTART